VADTVAALEGHAAAHRCMASVHWCCAISGNSMNLPRHSE
jgi:hypothetical protein